MTVSPLVPEASLDQSLDAASRDVMYLVKRRAYELAFAVAQAPDASAHGVQPRLHVRMRQPCQGGGFVLSLREVERFYEDLLQMMLYIQNERHGKPAPLALSQAAVAGAVRI
jgi:hypothetical protein